MSGPSIRLRVRVSPGAARSEIVGRHGEAWKVRVAAPAQHGKANEALVELLAKESAVPRGSIEITSGRGSRDKSVVIHGLGGVAETLMALPVGAT